MVPWRACSRLHLRTCRPGPTLPAALRLDPAAPPTVLAGIGPGTAARLGAVSALHKVQDLVGWLPRRYRSLRELAAPDEAAVGELVRLRGAVRSCRSAWLPGRRSMVTVAFVGAQGGAFEAQFFN